MISAYKWQMDTKLKYFRKIHLFKKIWLVSSYSHKTQEGRFYFNFHNICHYLQTFIFIPVKVIDWGDEDE